MNRLTREALRTRIWVALTVTPLWKKRPFGLDVERTRGEIVDDLVDRIMGPPESEAVILEPDMRSEERSTRRNRWGVEEPHPHPDLL